MFNKALGVFCLIIAVVTVATSESAMGDYSRVEVATLTTVILLGLIGFALFQIAENTQAKTSVSASPKDPEKKSISAGKSQTSKQEQ